MKQSEIHIHINQKLPLFSNRSIINLDFLQASDPNKMTVPPGATNDTASFTASGVPAASSTNCGGSLAKASWRPGSATFQAWESNLDWSYWNLVWNHVIFHDFPILQLVLVDVVITPPNWGFRFLPHHMQTPSLGTISAPSASACFKRVGWAPTKNTRGALWPRRSTCSKSRPVEKAAHEVETPKSKQPKN